jgi:acyl-CoA dehydrogenase
MDFDISPRARELSLRLEAFMEKYILPYNAAWHLSVLEGVYPPVFQEDLKTLAKDEELWNFFMPNSEAEAGGRGLANLDYAPLAEIMGRIPWAAEVFNCSAPDTGNMELLHRFASPMQRDRWLVPLLAGEIRSAFAMTEPDVGSSDPTNLTMRISNNGLLNHALK